MFYEIDKHCVRIGVKDTGRGIPQNMLEKIFERFEKVDSFAQGVGLGLSICKSIVDKMNKKQLMFLWFYTCLHLFIRISHYIN